MVFYYLQTQAKPNIKMTSVMVALVHYCNLLSALNEQQTIFLYSSVLSLRFEKCESSEF